MKATNIIRDLEGKDEYFYKIEANPRTESINDRFFLQAYENIGNARVIPRDVLFVGTYEQCLEWKGKLEKRGTNPLPSEIDIPKGIEDEEEISDYLSEVTGFCHKGFLLTDSTGI